eukprot:13465044-Alexandrium_andersonii.AAC.1
MAVLVSSGTPDFRPDERPRGLSRINVPGLLQATVQGVVPVLGRSLGGDRPTAGHAAGSVRSAQRLGLVDRVMGDGALEVQARRRTPAS